MSLIAKVSRYRLLQIPVSIMMDVGRAVSDSSMYPFSRMTIGTLRHKLSAVALNKLILVMFLDKYLFVSRHAWMPTRLSPLFKNCSVISDGLRNTLEKPIVNP